MEGPNDGGLLRFGLRHPIIWVNFALVDLTVGVGAAVSTRRVSFVHDLARLLARPKT